VPIPDLAVAKIKRFCESRTSPELRHEMRLEVDLRGNWLMISDYRPLWQGPGDWTRMKIAQVRYDPNLRSWSLYWADRNSRWHLYDDLEPTPNLDDVLNEIDEDPTCIFFG